MTNHARRARHAPCTMVRQKRLVLNVLKNQPKIRCTPAELKQWTGEDGLNFEALVREGILITVGAYYQLAPAVLAN